VTRRRTATPALCPAIHTEIGVARLRDIAQPSIAQPLGCLHQLTSTDRGPATRIGLDHVTARAGRWRAKITPAGQPEVDDLAVLVDRRVQVRPPSGDLDVGLVDKPPVIGAVAARSGCLDELEGEPLDLSLDRDMVNVHASLGQQLLDVTVRQAVPQVPPHRDRDRLARESGTCRRRH
jgi:hypothetical protein